MRNDRDKAIDLRARHESESTFHDNKWRRGSRPRHYDVNPTYPIYREMRLLAGDPRRKTVLEYGCGEGWITKELAHAGAMVRAFDISAEAVSQTRALLASAGLSEQCEVTQMGAEKLQYDDNSFDMAIGFAILHHLELATALRELYRVLKPGGTALFAEPLGTNPLINVYRRLTPQYRTADEAPLDLKAIAPLLSGFSSVSHSEYYLTALAAVAIVYLPGGGIVYPRINRMLMRFDESLLSAFPRLGRLAWYTILKLQK